MKIELKPGRGQSQILVPIFQIIPNRIISKCQVIFAEVNYYLPYIKEY
jgi:hypothetical protein